MEDANDAGTKNSHLCTLILTEGDSAKALAVAGLGVIGRDRYGVFPLRGKMLNVRDAAHKQIMENAEINAMLKILGLQYKVRYEDDEQMKSLRYGKVMIMADQVRFRALTSEPSLLTRWGLGSGRLAHQGPAHQLHPHQLAEPHQAELRRGVHHAHRQGHQEQGGDLFLLAARVHGVASEHRQLEDVQDQVLQGYACRFASRRADESG